ncbi:MAG: hypothetical protein ACLSH3_15855 [Alistipes finegoldii]
MKRTYCHEVNDEELRQTIIKELYDKAYAIATSGTMKHEREEKFNAPRGRVRGPLLGGRSSPRRHS